jgi:hypothetical protein
MSYVLQTISEIHPSHIPLIAHATIVNFFWNLRTPLTELL